MNVASETQFKGKLMFDEPMSKHTSWRLGGPADCYYIPADLHDLQTYLASLNPDIEILWVADDFRQGVGSRGD